MHLLIRRISPYTGADVLLGAFLTAKEAAAAKLKYAARYADKPDADPWRDQAYKDPGLSEHDLIIKEVPFGETADEVIVVSNYFDGLGLVNRDFDSIHALPDAALAREAELDAAEEIEVPHYALSQRVRVGILLSDAHDKQPGLHPVATGDQGEQMAANPYRSPGVEGNLRDRHVSGTWKLLWIVLLVGFSLWLIRALLHPFVP
jgi:hypothetical protein